MCSLLHQAFLPSFLLPSFFLPSFFFPSSLFLSFLLALLSSRLTFVSHIFLLLWVLLLMSHHIFLRSYNCIWDVLLMSFIFGSVLVFLLNVRWSRLSFINTHTVCLFLFLPSLRFITSVLLSVVLGWFQFCFYSVFLICFGLICWTKLIFISLTSLP